MYYCAAFCLAAASDEEKAEIIEIEIHSSNNLTEEGKRGRELTIILEGSSDGRKLIVQGMHSSLWK